MPAFNRNGIKLMSTWNCFFPALPSTISCRTINKQLLAAGYKTHSVSNKVQCVLHAPVHKHTIWHLCASLATRIEHQLVQNINNHWKGNESKNYHWYVREVRKDIWSMDITDVSWAYPFSYLSCYRFVVRRILSILCKCTTLEKSK
jgi:hypothetical protein